MSHSPKPSLSVTIIAGYWLAAPWGECLTPGSSSPQCGYGSQIRWIKKYWWLSINIATTRNISCMEFPSWPAVPTSVHHCRYSPPPPRVSHCTMGWLRSLMTPYQKFIRIWYGVIHYDSVFAPQKIFYIEYFSGVNIFQGWILFRGEYFSGVNIFQGWIFFRSEYFSGVNILNTES